MSEFLDLDDFDPDKKRMRRMLLPAPAYDPVRAKAAMDAACAAIEAQARKTVERVVEERLADYRREPWQLDAISPRLRSMPPSMMRAWLLEAIRSERTKPYRFSDAVLLINLGAALRYAKELCIAAPRAAGDAP